jgi:hypothetical protein
MEQTMQEGDLKKQAQHIGKAQTLGLKMKAVLLPFRVATVKVLI